MFHAYHFHTSYMPWPQKQPMMQLFNPDTLSCLNLILSNLKKWINWIPVCGLKDVSASLIYFLWRISCAVVYRYSRLCTPSCVVAPQVALRSSVPRRRSRRQSWVRHSCNPVWAFPVWSKTDLPWKTTKWQWWQLCQEIFQIGLRLVWETCPPVWSIKTCSS